MNLNFPLLLTFLFCSSLAVTQTGGAGYLSAIESKANQIEQNDSRVAVLNKQYQESYTLEADKLMNLKKQLRDLLAEKETVLEDYRKGYFCGGCDKPRSQFGPNEPFPHAGQKIVPAPPEKIAAKEKEYNDKIERLKASIQQFESNENEFTRKRADIDKQLSALKDNSDKLREEIVQLSRQYREAVVATGKKMPGYYITELMRILAEKHFIEDRINIIAVKLNDLVDEERNAIRESDEKVRKINDQEIAAINAQLEVKRSKLLQLFQQYTSLQQSLISNLRGLQERLFTVHQQLKNESKLNAVDKANLEAEQLSLERKIATIEKNMATSENEYTTFKNGMERESKTLEEQKWQLTTNLSNRQKVTSDLLKKAFLLRRKILNDGRVARESNLQQTGDLLLNKKAAARIKFLEFAEVVERERVRLMRACQKAGCSCFGSDTHSTVVGYWNRAEDCVASLDGVHALGSSFYGCTEESATYNQYYTSLRNGLSDSDAQALQRQSGKIRYEMLLKKVIN